MNSYRWMKTDTASIMFTCLSTKKWGRTFRMAAIFKDNDVDPQLVAKAAKDIMPRYPITYSSLRKGFFWNYQVGTELIPEIREETSRTLAPICYNKSGRPDFRLVYYKKRLAMETSHHLGDGKGAGEYFNALLERYVELLDDPESEYKPDEPIEEEFENAYMTNFIKGGEIADEDKTEAYHIPGEIEKGFMQLIFALIPVSQIKEKSKEKGMTITEFVASALILGTIKNAGKPIYEPVNIAIPVNLRRFYPSKTIRNFVVQSKIEFMPEGRTDWTFDEVCDKVKGQLKARLTPPELQKTLNRFGSLATNPVLGLVPNFIKQPVLRAKQSKSHSCFTTIFTNTGEAVLSDKVKDKIERFDGVNGDTSGYGLISTCSAVSANGFFNLCFSICSHDTSWPKACIRVLSDQGIDIRIESTNGNGEE